MITEREVSLAIVRCPQCGVLERACLHRSCRPEDVERFQAELTAGGLLAGARPAAESWLDELEVHRVD